MKRLIALCVVLGVASVAPLYAQISDNTWLAYEVLTEDYDALVKEAMNLSAEQWKAFEPVFEEYKAAMHPVFDRQINLIKAYADKEGKLTDDEAELVLVTMAEIERDEWLTLRDFERSFLEVLPAAKVLRFLQIENRMRLVLMSKIARDVPLAKAE